MEDTPLTIRWGESYAMLKKAGNGPATLLVFMGGVEHFLSGAPFASLS